MNLRTVAIGIVGCLACWAGAAHARNLPPPLTQLLENHCLDCHEGPEAKAGLDLTRLSFDLEDRELTRRWIQVHDRVRDGEMPPPKKAQPSEAARTEALASLSTALSQAERARAEVVLRRLNRSEYENTVRDLFGIQLQVPGLAEDTSTAGFDNVGEGLSTSAEALLAYLEASDLVIDAVLGPDKAPKPIRMETSLPLQVDWKGNPQLDSQYGKMFRRTPEGLVIFQSGYCPTSLVNFSRLNAPAGTYKGTVWVRAIQSEKPVTLRIYAGDTIVNRREQHLVGYYDIAPGKWTCLTFTNRLIEAGGTFQFKCYGTEDIRKDADTYSGPGIEIGDITIEGPLEPWPPESRSKLLGHVDPSKAGRPELETILSRLLPQAFRRPIDAREMQDYLALFEAARGHGDDFLTALRSTLKAVLCSPEFLFLQEPSKGPLTGYALANRLSYFLWSSMPDERLTQAASQGRLPAELPQQVERMLADPRADALVRNFTGQWLNLREIRFTEPDATLYPEFDELLQISMVQETELFFRDILERNRGCRDFIQANDTFLNERLARHYEIPGVEGQHFRRVSLPEGHVRGGLLTQAAILKVTANGTHTSPVLRGAWVLDRLLGQPSPPPPENVPAVEPDTRGATTIRDQLARHRNIASCASCHDRIDPPGFALEAFDPIGGFRDRYRITLESAPRPSLKRAPFTWAWIRYRIGPTVDATGHLPDGRTFQDIREFRQLLASDPEPVARNLVTRLLTYATGRVMTFADREAIEAILDKTRADDHGFRSILHQVVASPVFQNP